MAFPGLCCKCVAALISPMEIRDDLCYNPGYGGYLHIPANGKSAEFPIPAWLKPCMTFHLKEVPNEDSCDRKKYRGYGRA